MAFLDGADLGRVERVVYILHPTFKPNKYKVLRRAGPRFPFRARGWGAFLIKAKVYFKTGGYTMLRHQLVFR